MTEDLKEMDVKSWKRGAQDRENWISIDWLWSCKKPDDDDDDVLYPHKLYPIHLCHPPRVLFPAFLACLYANIYTTVLLPSMTAMFSTHFDLLDKITLL